MKTKVIIISGPPAAGKTYIATGIAKYLGIPLIVKYDLKEILFETLGTRNRDWSRLLGQATANILHHLLSKLLSTKTCAIIESAFYSDIESPVIREIIDDNYHRVTQIYCNAKTQTLLKRFEKRMGDINRYHGHYSPNAIEELRVALGHNRYTALDISTKLIKLRTDNIENIDIQKLIEDIP